MQREKQGSEGKQRGNKNMSIKEFVEEGKGRGYREDQESVIGEG